MPLPAISGAEPCIGSYIETFPGLTFPLAAIPREPIK